MPVGLDTETDGHGRAREQRLRMVQFGDTHIGWAIPADEYRGHIRYALDLLRARGNPIAIHNAMFDLDVLETAGLPLPHRHQTYDTMLLALHEDNTAPAGLKELCYPDLCPHLWALDRNLAEVFRRSKWTWADIPPEHPIYWRYAAADPVGCARLLHQQLARPHPAWADDLTFNETLRVAYRRGIAIDHDRRERAHATLDHQRREHERYLSTEWGLVNLGGADIGERLETIVGERLARTSKGAVSTSKAALADVSHPAAGALLAWRGARIEETKVRSWLDGDRVRPVLRPWSKDPNSDKARTGRASTVDPNLQAFTGTEKGPLRDCLVPEPDFRFVSVDYSNQELRLLAHFTDDRELQRAFEDGLDIHDFVSRMVGVERSVAKTLNFALPYGAGIDKLAATVGCSEVEMKAHLDRLAEVLPGLGTFVETHEGKSWPTIGGRTVNPDPDRPYTSGNYRIQGSGADVLKTAVARIDAAGMSEYIAASVHDELLFQFPERHAIALTHEVVALMERDDTNPPLTVDYSRPVERWGEAK